MIYHGQVESSKDYANTTDERPDEDYSHHIPSAPMPLSPPIMNSTRPLPASLSVANSAQQGKAELSIGSAGAEMKMEMQARYQAVGRRKLASREVGVQVPVRKSGWGPAVHQVWKLRGVVVGDVRILPRTDVRNIHV